MEETKTYVLKKIAAIFVVLVVIFLLTAIYYQFVIVPKNRVTQQTNAYQASLLQDKPETLQNLLASDIKNGTNDMYTKSAAYFITHRYFDNGGNMYEIYDYINAHPELSFLKEAEKIYPDTFKRLEDGTMAHDYSDAGLYAYLAYSEVLAKHGYVDVALRGTVANQYAKMAYFSKVAMQEKSKNEPVPGNYQYMAHDIRKAIGYAQKAQGDIVKILNGELTSKDLPARDILVGLNQYASAVRYLEALQANYSSPVSAKDIFAFTTDYSYRNVRELYLFTSLLNASTLTLSSSSTVAEIRNALFPILDYGAKGDKPVGIMEKIVNARLEKKPLLVTDINFDMYGKRNVAVLGNKVPEFKAWLMKNDWQESDFK